MNNAVQIATENNLNTALKMHPWERSGLGKAPFRYDGFEVKMHVNGDGTQKPGSSCDYCANSIANCFWIKSADGRRFKVGCDCVAKLEAESNLDAVKLAARYDLTRADIVLIRKVREAKNATLRAKSEVKAKAVKASLEVQLADDAIRTALASQAHPKGFKDWNTGAPLTLLDWAEWMLANAGAAGRAKIAKAIKPFV